MYSQRLLTPMTWLVVIMAVVPLSSASLDPKELYCRYGCQDFLDVSKQCSAMRNCSDYAEDNDVFARCVKPCKNLAYGCEDLCLHLYITTRNECTDQCIVSDNYNCVWDCFQTKFAKRRDELFTLPSPDIGPFQP